MTESTFNNEAPSIFANLSESQTDDLTVECGPASLTDAELETMESAPDESHAQAIDYFQTSAIQEDRNQPIGSESSMNALVKVLKTSVGNSSNLSPHMIRRVKDFHFAQRERLKNRDPKPFGVVGFFASLSDVRVDLRWAEDAAWRREHGEPYVSWADFEAEKARGLGRPYLTYFLVIACSAMMLVAFHVGGWKFETFDVNPLAGPNAGALLKVGAMNTQTAMQDGSWYRLVTPIFLHAGLFHFLLNVTALYYLGSILELNHGLFATFIFFFVPGIGGNILSGFMEPINIQVGASGGIFGLIGACLADIMLNWKLMFLVFKDHYGKSASCLKFWCFFWLCADLTINCLFGMTPFVDNYAHMGGLLYGFLLALAMTERLSLAFFGKGDGCGRKFRTASLQVFGYVSVITLLLLSVLLLSRSDGRTSPCPRCRYISCAPMPFWSEDKWWRCDGCDGSIDAKALKSNSSPFYTEVEIFCPFGGAVVEDVSDYQFTELNEIIDTLPEFCRKLC
jgi:membrane associated rhomboid family serine protease